MIKRYYHPSLEEKLNGNKNLRFSSSLTVLFFCIPQPVILKELKQMEGDFSENQRIQLNTVRQLSVGFTKHSNRWTKLTLILHYS